MSQEMSLFDFIQNKKREFDGCKSYKEICELAKELYIKNKSYVRPKEITDIKSDENSSGDRTLFIQYVRYDEKKKQDVKGCSYFIFMPSDPEAWLENWIWDLNKDYFY